jgi:class 3 adenylate cyclase/pimeloyl-ACP methyl ester carboxylesterase
VTRPDTHYARSGELAIAYQVHGEGDRDLLVNTGTASNIETAWEIPEGARFLERLGRFARVIRFDRRDSGLSDPIRDDLTLEAHADDALAVIEAVGAEQPVLMGSLDGARSLAVLAATRPGLVGGLIAISPSVRGGAAGAPEFTEAIEEVLAQLTDWPGPQTMASYAPDWANDPVRADRLKRYIQSTATPRQAARLLRMSLTSDIRDVLPLVQTPTLVIHPPDLELVRVDAVREFVGLIPDVIYREVRGNAAMAFALDINEISELIEAFVTGTTPAAATNRILATVLFTDLVDSTSHAARTGDRAWSDVLDRHFQDARAAVSSLGGETIKTTGDGVLALFTGPGQGVRCAERVIADARGMGLDARIGLHTGEVERSADDVAGLAVHLAARIMGRAEAGEILVSGTVRDLVIGSELTFSDRGEHELKGIPGRWSLYAAA